MTGVIGIPISLLGILMMCTIILIVPGMAVFLAGGWPMAAVLKRHIRKQQQQKTAAEKEAYHEPGIPPWLQDNFDIDDYPYGLN